jgi:hypothetical protein
MNYALMIDDDSQSAILFLLAVPPKRGGNIPFNASCAGSSPSNSSLLSSAFRSVLWDEIALTRDYRSALKLKSMQVVERLASPTGFEPVFTP